MPPRPWGRTDSAVRWSPGTLASVGGHAALVVWLIAGWGFRSEPLPFEVSEVSIITSEDYAALVEATTPQTEQAPVEPPAAPVVESAPALPEETPAPSVPRPPTPPPAPPVPETPPPPAPEPPPPPLPPSDTPPELGPAQDEVVAAPNFLESDDPVPLPSDRVAPTPVAPPPPEATPDEVVREETVAEPEAEAPPAPEETESTAPEEATTQIVTEAETPRGRVTETPRPPARPDRPVPAPEPEPEIEVAETEPEPQPVPEEPPAPETDTDAIAAALAAAAAVEAPEVSAQPGPPMTGSEQEGFRLAVNACWNVDPGSQAARVTMSVAFSLDRDGRVQGEVRQVGATGGDAGATEIAFQAARRAILRCQGQGGYNLPAEKYEQWREVEITFDPSGMRLR